MMVDRRHLEDALAGELERDHLHDHRHRLEHEQAADHGENDLVLGGDRDGTDHAAERQRAGIAHEDRGRRRVEPEKAQAGAEHRAAQHRKLAGAIITGTMARPSRPSVRFTALPAPTMMKDAKNTKNQPRLSTTSLKNGNTSVIEICVWPSRTRAMAASTAMRASMPSRVRAEKPFDVCFLTFR